MKVKELIKKLEELNEPDMSVRVMVESLVSADHQLYDFIFSDTDLSVVKDDDEKEVLISGELEKVLEQ